MTSLQTARRIALAEAITFLVLLAGLIARTGFNGPDLSNTIGPIHGVGVVAYAASIVHAREDQGWSRGATAALLLAAIIPFGGAVVAHRFWLPVGGTTHPWSNRACTTSPNTMPTQMAAERSESSWRARAPNARLGSGLRTHPPGHVP